MISEVVRRFGFWALDFLNNGAIKDHYEDIRRGYRERNFHAKYLESRLGELLDHASTTTEFYREFKGYGSLDDFPVVDKNVIKANQNDMLSSSFRDVKLHYMSTSGSTGTPFTIGQDKNKRNRVLAEIVYFGDLCGYRIGDRNAFLRVWTKSNMKSSFAAWKQNMVMIDTTDLSERNLEMIRATLKQDKRLKCILAYASSLDLLAKYLRDVNDTPDMFGIEIIISSSEILSEATRQNLQDVFDCNVVSRYANQENGILAQEQINADFFLINDASYNIEFLKSDSDTEAEEGELSRIVVTDIFNYASPMIRYNTGDLAIYSNKQDLGKVIVNIQGRRTDFIYDTKGRMLSPHSITNNMWEFSNVKQYQLVQDDFKKYTMKLNDPQELCDEGKLLSSLKDVLGGDAQITIERVSGIPFLESGKYRPVVCNLKMR